eukprot:CAMPEP_0204224578 /NCGR_PEP_ID=MMETSP0361-20130328/83547_1 /ASSEMBLY_ACC=CAM_ASM_000343 /TAXON_ID=268821 /ORGANISM="Scrippsiella Hangoei, Strain SHTV-5" /LENGTH=46 /DNA_ID= /DNA_START= /DNA_END= /DNA_ORIENTATION=
MAPRADIANGNQSPLILRELCRTRLRALCIRSPRAAAATAGATAIG